MTIKLSVVVIGRNEGQRLVRCLESIKQMRGFDPLPEIIYVDSNSTDGSPDAARALGVYAAVLQTERPTAALGRNAGWRQAQGEFILFLDGDTILHPDFPRLSLAALSENNALAAVWGNLREIHPENSIYNRVLDLDWIFPAGLTDICGGNVMMRREALERTGGFDATLIAGEEPELCRRIRAMGYKILHIDAPMAGHDLAMRHFGQYWKRAIRSGHAYAEISNRFRNSGDPLWQSLRKRNLIQASFWIVSIVIAVGASLFMKSAVPIAIWCAVLLLLSARSAWKFRWKSNQLVTLLLYGFHSHFQQIPICIGQLAYELHRLRGKKRKLIEYKNNA